MAVTASGLYYLTIRDIFQNDSAVDLVADTIKVAMYTNSLTPAFDTDAAYSATAEVSGTGYSAGGTNLSGNAISVSPAGTFKFTGSNTSWTTSTITNARCAILYDDTIASPTANPLVLLVNFGADYSTSAGTFTIQWAAAGIFTIDLTP